MNLKTQEINCGSSHKRHLPGPAQATGHLPFSFAVRGNIFSFLGVLVCLFLVVFVVVVVVVVAVVVVVVAVVICVFPCLCVRLFVFSTF